MTTRVLRLILWVCAAVLGACRADPKSTAPEAPAAAADVVLRPEAMANAAVRLGKPRRGRAISSLPANGQLEFVPRSVSRVGSLVEGRVMGIHVQPGDRVDKGALLATLVSVQATRARAGLSVAMAKLDQARIELDRQETLASRELTTGQALVAARTNREVAEAELHALTDELRTLGAQGAFLELRAPMSGTVLVSEARLGQAVAPSTQLFVVGTIDTLWLEVDVYERDLGRVRVGDEVRVVAVAYPGREYIGHVDYLDAVVDPVRRTVSARIVLPNVDGQLRPGMSASARILGSLRASRVEAAGSDAGTDTDGGITLVPRAAVQSIDGLPVVFVARGPGRFAMTPVELGEEADSEVVVLQGLTGTEEIAIAGTFLLKSELLREQMGKND